MKISPVRRRGLLRKSLEYRYGPVEVRREIGTKNPLAAPASILIRGERVMLDADLASLYGVETGNLNLAVRRNLARFPADFMFQLRAEDAAALRSQIAISNAQGRGGRYLPYALTEQGVAILAAAKSPTEASLPASSRTTCVLRASPGVCGTRCMWK